MFDDSLQVHLVRSYQSLSEVLSVDCFDLFRPVKNLVFYLWVSYLPDQIQIWRVSAILIFLGLIPLAYRFFGLFFKNKPWSQLLCTAAWAIAPASTTVVSWISSVNIIICAYGFFAYFILYEKAQNDASEKRIHASYFALCLSLLSLVVACFSYEAAMTAPFLCFLKDFLQHPKRYRSSHSRMFYGLSLSSRSIFRNSRNVWRGQYN